MIPYNGGALGLEIEPDVEDGGAVRKPADRDQIDAGRGERRRRFWRDPPRGFSRRAAIDYRDRLGELIHAHVVEKHGIGALAERLLELVQIIDFDFDFDEMTGSRAGTPQRLRDPPRDGDMIVLDKDGVVEAEAVIGAAARAHRVFLDRAKTGRGLAGADDLGLCAAHRRDDGSRRARYSTEMPKKIESGALRHQNPARWSTNPGDDAARRDRRAVVYFNLHRDIRIDELEGEFCQI